MSLRRTTNGEVSPPADSRTRVIQAQRQAEARACAEAPLHALTPVDRRKLWQIADKPISDEQKIIQAFHAVPRLTATDLALDLLVGSPHPRISELRRAGVPIATVGRVRQPWGRGFARPVALYELAEG